MEKTKRRYKEAQELIEAGMTVRRATLSCGICVTTYYTYKKKEESSIINRIKRFLRIN